MGDAQRASPARELQWIRAVTEAFAAFVHDLAFTDLPATAVHQAKLHLLDAVGDALAAVNEEAVRIALDFVRAEGGHGQATILGSDQTTSPSGAAFVNGVMGHVLDFDDWGTSAGHHDRIVSRRQRRAERRGRCQPWRSVASPDETISSSTRWASRIASLAPAAVITPRWSKAWAIRSRLCRLG
jgi:hypothetical protein